jgi:hypothetical protein|tara:strand:+ start:307 stop:660 length:354 start_codon:yes stop_codon:yes gene_type:complete
LRFIIFNEIYSLFVSPLEQNEEQNEDYASELPAFSVVAGLHETKKASSCIPSAFWRRRYLPDRTVVWCEQFQAVSGAHVPLFSAERCRRLETLLFLLELLHAKRVAWWTANSFEASN